MKKYLWPALMLPMALAFQFCSSSKKTAKTDEAKVTTLTYEGDVKPLLTAKCAPCHVAPNGKKTLYDSYANTKTDIDDIIRRVHLNPGERGFMPFRSQTKLSDSVITILEKWKATGMTEK